MSLELSQEPGFIAATPLQSSGLSGETYMRKLSILLVLISLAIAFSSCTAKRRNAELKPTAFLNAPGVDPSSKLENLPFLHSWVSAEMQGKVYSKIMVAPVVSSYVSTDNWKLSESVAIEDQETYANEVKALADFTTEKLTEALKDSSQKRYQVVTTASPGTLIIEMALTEVVFGNPIAAAGALAAPIPGTAVVLSAVTDPSVSYEVRLRDASSKKIIATAADRAFSTKRLVNFNKLTATSACRDIMGDATGLIVKVLKEGRLAKVSKRWFELKPW